MTRLVFLLFVPLLFFVPLLYGQDLGHAHHTAVEEQTDPELLPSPIAIRGLGNSHLAITANAEAQRWFDQGLNALHDFWDYEAARAFQESVRADRECAMCCWGLYRALSFFHSNNQGYAAGALAKAVALRPHARLQEQLYIDATLAGSRGQWKMAGTLWRELVQKYPKDDQAKLLLASSVGGAESLQLYRSILKDKPDDSAANHYLIHALEATEHASDALPSASVLAKLAPQSGHMVHMPGHIYFLLGQYGLAEKSFAQSMHVDERYMRKQHVRVDDDWNYVHNLMYAVANLMEAGRLREARALSARKLPEARGQLQSTLYVYQPRDSIARVDPSLPVLLRTADWVSVRVSVEQRQIPQQYPNLQFLARELLNFAKAMQSYKNGSRKEAERCRKAFDDELSAARLRDQSSLEVSLSARGKPQRAVSPDALLRPILGNLTVMSSELRGWSQAVTGRLDEAGASFAEAARAEAAMGYREPPAYIRPVRESEGEAFLQAKSYARAMLAYEAALKQRPRSGFALYGAAMAAEQAGETARAQQRYADLLRYWKHSDAGLPQVAKARKFVSQIRARPDLVSLGRAN